MTEQSMTVHTCDPALWRFKQENHELSAHLDYTVRLYLNHPNIYNEYTYMCKYIMNIHILYDFIYMKYQRRTNPKRQKVGWKLPGFVSFQDSEFFGGNTLT